MKKTMLSLSLILLLSSCSQKLSHHPRNPNYKINKPEVKYKPSKKNLEKMIKKLQGSPYVWAEEGPNNFDCSGFTYYLYGSMGIDIPRIARNQAKYGKQISANELQYGDLIFFATNKKNPYKITHVGIYLGKGWFTHASTTKNEVIYSNLLTSSYYKKRLRTCRRYLPDTNTKINTNQVIAPQIETPQVSMPSKDEEVFMPVKSKRIKEKAFSKKTSLSKAIVIKAPIEEIEKTHPHGSFYVQVGSFLGKPKNTLIQQIEQNGFQHKIIRFPVDGKEISKLLIGPYETREEIVQILDLVRQNIKSDAFIAEIR